jgi:hypothetical protein
MWRVCADVSGARSCASEAGRGCSLLSASETMRTSSGRGFERFWLASNPFIHAVFGGYREAHDMPSVACLSMSCGVGLRSCGCSQGQLPSECGAVQAGLLPPESIRTRVQSTIQRALIEKMGSIGTGGLPAAHAVAGLGRRACVRYGPAARGVGDTLDAPVGRRVPLLPVELGLALCR